MSLDDQFGTSRRFKDIGCGLMALGLMITLVCAGICLMLLLIGSVS